MTEKKFDFRNILGGRSKDNPAEVQKNITIKKETSEGSKEATQDYLKAVGNKDAAEQNLAKQNTNRGRFEKAKANIDLEKLTDNEQVSLDVVEKKAIQLQNEALKEYQEAEKALQEVSIRIKEAKERVDEVTEPNFVINLVEEEVINDEQSGNTESAKTKKSLWTKLKERRERKKAIRKRRVSRGAAGGGRHLEGDSASDHLREKSSDELQKSKDNAKRVIEHGKETFKGIGAIAYGVWKTVSNPVAGTYRTLNTTKNLMTSVVESGAARIGDSVNLVGGTIREGSANAAAKIIRGAVNSEVPEIREAMESIRNSDNAEVIMQATKEIREEMSEMRTQNKRMTEMMAQFLRSQGLPKPEDSIKS